MGNGYNHHLHHQQSFYSKNSFLPILCRVSIKDVKLKDFKDRSSSFSGDPSSPKVSCMGQVKRNNRVIGFPTPYRLTSSTATTAITPSKTNSGHLKYSKLRRLFSGRNLMPSSSITTTSATKAAAAASCGSSRGICRNGSRRSSKINNDNGNSHDKNSKNNHVEVNISELDPPLPVVKNVQPRPEVNLWQRRSGGMTLKSLQVEQIHQLPNNNNNISNNYLPAPTV